MQKLQKIKCNFSKKNFFFDRTLRVNLGKVRLKTDVFILHLQK